MYISHKKCELSGHLILAVPSEGCLGQRIVDRLLDHEKTFEHVGSFNHEVLQPMVGIVVDGRTVTCMELFWSSSLKLGIVQLRAPPFNRDTFCDVFHSWFETSGTYYTA